MRAVTERPSGKLLTPELLAWIGRSEPPVTEQVTRREIRKYALASGQTLSKYLNGDEAPPLFHSHYFDRLAPLDELEEDGHVPETIYPPLPLKRIMAGGREIEYFRPIRAGDVLTGTRSLFDLYEKEGKSGPLIFVVIQLRVTDQAGNPVVVERYTRIFR
jgi:hydroxyacyl-ACP dehydratase HTD2-like protein with hotdog domain